MVRVHLPNGLLLTADPTALEGALSGLSRSFQAGFPRSVGEAQGVATRAVAMNFRTGGHGQWAPPKPSTLKQRKVKKTPPALTDTGVLQGAFASPGAPFSVGELTPHGFVRGTDAPDAAAHQFGRKRGGKRVEPARPFAILSDQEEREIVDIIAADVRGRAKQASAR